MILNSSPSPLSHASSHTTLSSELDQSGSKNEALIREIKILQHSQTAVELSDLTKDMVKQIVKRDLFPLKQFIEVQELNFSMDSNEHTISSIILQKLPMSNTESVGFWNSCKPIVYQTVISLRATRINHVKSVFKNFIVHNCEFS